MADENGKESEVIDDMNKDTATKNETDVINAMSDGKSRHVIRWPLCSGNLMQL